MDSKLINFFHIKKKANNPLNLTLSKINKLYEKGERKFFSSKVFINFIEYGLHNNGPRLEFLDHEITDWLLERQVNEIDFIEASKNATYNQFKDMLEDKVVSNQNVLKLTG